MAERYFVAGGDGNWGSTNNWAATKTGAAGETVPGASDNVYLTDVSPNSLVLNTSTRQCLNFDATGYIGTISGSNIFVVNGGITLSPTTVWNHTGSFVLNASTGTFSITTNGVSFSGLVIIGPASGGTAIFNIVGPLTTTGGLQIRTGNVSLSGDVTLGGDFTLTGGTALTGSLTTNNYNITCAKVLCSNSNIRALVLGTSTITASSTENATTVDFTTTTNLTFSGANATLKLNASADVDRTIHLGGLTWGTVWLATAGTGKITVYENNTIGTFRYDNTNATSVLQFANSANNTITTLNVTGGYSGIKPQITSVTAGSAATITTNSNQYLYNVSLKDITFAGTGIIYCQDSTNVSGNSGTGLKFLTTDRYGSSSGMDIGL